MQIIKAKLIVGGRDISGLIDISVDIIRPTPQTMGQWGGAFENSNPLLMGCGDISIQLENGETSKITIYRTSGAMHYFGGTDQPPPSLLRDL